MSVQVVKASGHREPFSEEKLRLSLLNAGADEDQVEKVLNHVKAELHDELSTDKIYKHAYSILEHISKPLARSYSLRRAIMELGPSGFPFEDFVAEVLRARGYECLTRQQVMGGCVPHEVDVVAWTDKKLVMVEAKFHNELGTKSDLKVVLYVKARIDDLKENMYDYGGETRKMTEGWLVTNTKFSSTAIHYGQCNGVTMIGWNYPQKGNLQDMIEEEGLHPITCLHTLHPSEKNLLLTARVVLCSQIREKNDLLTEILGQHFDSHKVINEINELYA